MSHRVRLVRRVLAGAAGLAFLAACSAPVPPRAVAAAPAKPVGPPVLPAPTGTQPVGTTALHLKDTARPDPWVPEAPVRELKVTLWYPAQKGEGRPAVYMTAKESELALKGKRVTGVPYDLLSRTRTHAVTGVKPAGRVGGLPLVVLSPGFTNPVSTLTSLAEELASRGYVVAGIDHTYENYATTFPDGRVADCVACDSDSDSGFGTKVAGVRAADVAFVLDRLTGSAWEGSGLINRSKIAMVGQSIGGAAALAAMVKDARIRAGANMDGTTYARMPGGMARPFLFLGSSGHAPGGRDNSWERDWKLLTGWKRWLFLPGGNHQSFTDIPLLSEAAGVAVPGELTAARSVELTRTYVLAFLDRHLRGGRAELPGSPEVTIARPG
ncbi:alpha/beta hydrolase family protein [Nonomuraea typhae]|uniref:alpha/beta hydrolase family protein n=1 Tax=Nonomuraea typhae TaxID=2603600 RepID=UPI001FE7A78C|nr:alpha/beta hydrolase [Nonomuraea typhae]